MTGPIFREELIIPTFHLGQTIRTNGGESYLIGRVVRIGPYSDNLYIPGRYYELPNMWVSIHVLGERFEDRDVLVKPDNPNKRADFEGNYTNNVMAFTTYDPREWPKPYKSQVPCIPYYRDKRHENAKTVEKEMYRCGPSTLI